MIQAHCTNTENPQEKARDLHKFFEIKSRTSRKDPKRMCSKLPRKITWIPNDEMYQNNEGHPAAFFFSQKEVYWPMVLCLDLEERITKNTKYKNHVCYRSKKFIHSHHIHKSITHAHMHTMQLTRSSKKQNR